MLDQADVDGGPGEEPGAEQGDELEDHGKAKATTESPICERISA